MILDNIIQSGIKNLTWTGGEALLYPDIEQLLKYSSNCGIKNVLITNGQIYMESVFNFVDEIAMSLDSLDKITNISLGRGENHFTNLFQTFCKIKSNHPNILVRINTVFNSYNFNQVNDIKYFLENNNINKWRIHKFSPLRSYAKKNAHRFLLQEEQFNTIIYNVASNTIKIEIRKDDDFHKLYYMIIPNGKLFITTINGDKDLGNAKNQEVFSRFLDEKR